MKLVSIFKKISSVLTGELAANECEDFIGDQNSVTSTEGVKPIGRLVHQRSADAIEEENEADLENKPCGIENGADALPTARLPPRNSHLSNSVFKMPSVSNYNNYVWRIDLSKTEPFWNGWFKGLSQKFLDVQAPKVLLLANIHGLDTSLTVGQMQGKFQLQVLPKSGHAIHEDQPHRVADIVAGFLVKQKLAIGKVDILVMPAC